MNPCRYNSLRGCGKMSSKQASNQYENVAKTGNVYYYADNPTGCPNQSIITVHGVNYSKRPILLTDGHTLNPNQNYWEYRNLNYIFVICQTLGYTLQIQTSEDIKPQVMVNHTLYNPQKIANLKCGYLWSINL